MNFIFCFSEYKKFQEKERQEKLEAARAENKLLECQCCFNDSCLPEDMYNCGKREHKFCLDCLKNHAKETIGNGKSNFSWFLLGCLRLELGRSPDGTYCIWNRCETLGGIWVEP